MLSSNHSNSTLIQKNTNSNSKFVLDAVCNQWMEQYHLYGAHHIVLFLVWILALLLVLPITASNMFAMYVFLKKDQMKMLSNILLLHNALCDAMFGCIALPLWTVHLGFIIFTRNYGCSLMALLCFFALSFPWMSFATTFLISVDKHVAIFHPYFYDEKVKGRRRVFIVPILLSWVIMVLLQLTWFFTKVPLLQSAPFIIPIFCTYSIYVYVRIYILVKKTRNTMHSMEVGQGRRSSSSRGRSQDNTKDIKAARLTSMILASLCICYLPYFTLQTVVMTYGNLGPSLSPTTHTAYPVVLLIGATKCLINPLLYYYQKKAVRDVVTEVSMQVTRSFSRQTLESQASD